jgi:hypothetical protein
MVVGSRYFLFHFQPNIRVEREAPAMGNGTGVALRKGYLPHFVIKVGERPLFYGLLQGWGDKVILSAGRFVF